MNVLYFDLGMGAAGDMLTASLYELLNENQKKEFLETINNAGIPGVKVEAEKSVKCGISGTHIKVTVAGQEEGEHHEHEYHEHGHEHHEHHHHHSSMEEITNIIKNLKLPEKVKTDAIEIYKLIASAESRAHGVPVTEIHFHEVGTMDAIADITAFCLILQMLSPQKIYASPVHVGSGQVHCAHGILPVPAPATASILEGIPVYGGSLQGELCTPTGAALLKHFVNSFGNMPCLSINASGYGMGKKDFEAANCVRVISGQLQENSSQIVEFTCNLDDISAEVIGFAIEKFFEEGAVEAYTIPVNMKKSRPGLLLCVMCHEADKDKIISAIFKYTTTLGIRQNISKRYTLDRKEETIQTPYGQVHVKYSQGYGVSRKKIEYEDLAQIARKTGKSIQEISDEIKI